MKKINFLLIASFLLISIKSNAQIQRGNALVGADIGKFNLDLGGSGAFQASLDPKVAYFLRDNLALGVYLDFGLITAKESATITNYGAGVLGRYYLSDPKTVVVKHGRFFLEGNAGIQGRSISHGSSTTGLGLGIGPGFAYFVTPNIGLEGLLKYNGIVGFGNQTYTSSLNLGIGFQVYLGGKNNL